MSKGAPTQQEDIDHINEAVELLHSAYINLLNNGIDRVPRLGDLPLIKVGKMQFKEGLKLLGREVD